MKAAIVGVVALTLVFAGIATTGWSDLQDSSEAQAVIDEALALWENTKRLEGLDEHTTQARSLLERVLAEYPDTEQAADALRHLAFGHAWKGLRQESEVYYEALFAGYPTSKARERAWLDRAMFVAQEGRHDLAIEYCRNVLEHFPDGPAAANAKYDIADYETMRSNWAEALRWYERAATEHPDTQWGQRGALRAAEVRLNPLDDTEGAVTAFARVIATTQDDQILAAAILGQAEAHLRGEDAQAALLSLARFEHDPRLAAFTQDARFEPTMLLLVARAQLATGDEAKGVQTLTRLASGPVPEAAAQARMTLGDFLVSQGRLYEAVGEFRALMDNPGAPVWYRGRAALKLGDLLRSSGSFDEAIAAYSQVLDLVPDHKGLTSAARIAISMAQEERAAQTGDATSLRPLSPEEMGAIAGGAVHNDETCGDKYDGCGSACIPLEGSGGYLSKQARDWEYKVCRPKYWWEPSQSCYDDLWVKCAQWRYYGSDNCGGTFVEGEKLYTWACEGTTG